MAKYDQEILNAVGLRGTLSVVELSEMLGVSDQTIRRIVKPLVDAGLIKKVHGAIVSVDNPTTEPFQVRLQHNREAKAQIASKIAELIPDGASVAIDAGSSAGFVAKALQIRKNLTVVTNSAFVASTLSLKKGNKVFFAGTQLRDYDGASYDRTAFNTVESLRVDYCVLTASLVHHKRGFLMAEQSEADMAKAMTSIAEQTIFAVDHSKLVKNGTQGLLSIGELRPQPWMITDEISRGAGGDFDDIANVIVVS
ncbi:DeoR/GlpR family DNA-binding transcription regulator [Aliiroseovarius sp. KMU-50]|uniref:DeoR/GlpR family DNA-binding transcription regulator n=1 Tax=Aliiroseovarius salicola TaxID=3009082 RepID=A0ABT4W0V7_9RHOB|nr:DeoR/GlpR family DNA-binding transcription regulator [Aliiroseovarius sp. KMU-50]MDA5094138.1 DeoR/GlpR family DNA-binding transcription regulator [Aliiroseovarius sp. KMU-50]